MENLQLAKIANQVRKDIVTGVYNAKSGHPGGSLSAADMLTFLYFEEMNVSPEKAKDSNRDRFVLSKGHVAPALYSVLAEKGYFPREDIKTLRKPTSYLQGHPDMKKIPGIDMSSGSLGQGISTAVGMAMAETHLASKFNTDEYKVVDHYTYVLGGDGCMMEGISYEAFSLAGTLGLEKLIVLYDSNNISIEGDTNIAFRENVRQRFESFGFHTQLVEDGNDLDAIGKAIEAARQKKADLP